MKIVFISIYLLALSDIPSTKSDTAPTNIAPIADGGDINVAPMADGDTEYGSANGREGRKEGKLKSKSCLSLILGKPKSGKGKGYLHCMNSLAHMQVSMKMKVVELLVDGCEEKVFGMINILDNLWHEEKRQQVKDEYEKCMNEYKIVLCNTKGALEDVSKSKKFFFFTTKSNIKHRLAAREKILHAFQGVKACNQGLKKVASTSPIAKKNDVLFTSFHLMLQITVRVLF